MKIYRAIEIDMRSGSLLKEDSFEYDGPLELCFGGGGSGGGSAGTSELPAYIKAVHAEWLANTGADGTGHVELDAGYDMTTIMQNALNGSTPYTDINRGNRARAYNPDDSLDSIIDRLTDLEGEFSKLNGTTSWQSYWDDVKAKIESELSDPTVSLTAPASGDIPTPTATDIPVPVSTDIAKPSSTLIVGYASAVASALSAVADIKDSTDDETAISNAVDAFEARGKTQFLRDFGLWAAGMADINAVNSSAFMIGAALRQDGEANRVANFDSEVRLRNHELRLQAYLQQLNQALQAHAQDVLQQWANFYADKLREHEIYYTDKAQIHSQYYQDQLLSHENYYRQVITIDQLLEQKNARLAQITTQALSTLLQLVATRVDSYSMAAQLAADIYSRKITAKQSQWEWDLEMDVEEALWDLKVFGFGGNLLASGFGGVEGKNTKPSKGQTIIGGAFAGASIGSKFGPWGAGIGGIIGGIGGAIF